MGTMPGYHGRFDDTPSRLPCLDSTPHHPAARLRGLQDVRGPVSLVFPETAFWTLYDSRMGQHRFPSYRASRPPVHPLHRVEVSAVFRTITHVRPLVVKLCSSGNFFGFSGSSRNHHVLYHASTYRVRPQLSERGNGPQGHAVRAAIGADALIPRSMVRPGSLEAAAATAVRPGTPTIVPGGGGGVALAGSPAPLSLGDERPPRNGSRRVHGLRQDGRRDQPRMGRWLRVVGATFPWVSSRWSAIADASAVSAVR
jgi:hypothetical protein